MLFVFAVTSSANVGWADSEVLTPLMISVFMLAGFFVWEARVPVQDAAMYVPLITGVVIIPNVQ